jgi:hypothetical protein
VNRVKDRFRVKARNMAGSGIVVRAIAAFVVSNIDGLVLLALLFSVRRGAGTRSLVRVLRGRPVRDRRLGPRATGCAHNE